MTPACREQAPLGLLERGALALQARRHGIELLAALTTFLLVALQSLIRLPPRVSQAKLKLEAKAGQVRY